MPPNTPPSTRPSWWRRRGASRWTCSAARCAITSTTAAATTSRSAANVSGRSARRASRSSPTACTTCFGRFDPVAGARIETALAAMAGRMWRAEDAKNRATPQQRFADALETLITRDGSGKSQSTTLLVIADYDTTAGRLQNPRLADGTQLAAEELVRLACEAAILPAVLDAKSQPLWLGREHRHASDGQRAVLAARDKGLRRLWPQSQPVPTASHRPCGRRWTHRHRQSLHALHPLPPQGCPRVRRPNRPEARRKIRTPAAPTISAPPTPTIPTQRQRCQSVRWQCHPAP